MFYLWIAGQIPYTHDDWDWGLPIGIHQLLSANLNSRYVGNFFVVVMTRSEILKTIIMGLSFFFLPLWLSRIAGLDYAYSKQKEVILFLISNVFILSMSSYIWQQTYGWVSGFANYVLSAFFILFWIREFFSIFACKINRKKSSPITIAIHTVISFLGQLFLENLAIYFFGISVVICFLEFYQKKPCRKHIFMFIAACVGLIIMFSSSIYDSLWSTGKAVGGYRELYLSTGQSPAVILSSILTQIMRLLTNMCGRKNLIISCSMPLLLIWNIFTNKRISALKKIPISFVNMLMAYVFLHGYLFGYGAFEKYPVFEFTLSLFYFILISGEILFLCNTADCYKHKLLIVWLSSLLVILPFAVTSESGPRIFFSSYLLQILFVCMLLKSILDSYSVNTIGKFTLLSVLLLIPLLLFYGHIYYEISTVYNERLRIISMAIQENATEITLPGFPHTQYLWKPNPAKDLEDLRIQYFKEFYKLPENIKIIFN